MAPGNHMMTHLNDTILITADDGREFTGKLLVFDRHMNVVLSDVKESRSVSKKNDTVAERSLGLLLLRGERIVSLRSLAKPSAKSESSSSALPSKKAAGDKKRAREE